MSERRGAVAPGLSASRDEPVLIIGAGAAGLVVAAELRRAGVESEILERGSAVGSSWRSHYDRLALNTCRWFSKLSHEPFPRKVGVFPTRDEWVRYLESYAERHKVQVRFGVRVNRIDPCDGGWRVTTSAGDRIARQVVVAMGHQHTPQLPDWPGRQAFGGRVLHASEYHSAEGFAGADVLVVGAGCSAMDIAYDLAVGGAARVRIAVRTQPNLWLRRMLGVPGDLILTAFFRLPTRRADQLAAILRRVLIGDLSRWGLTPPEEGNFSRTARIGSGQSPTIINKSVIRAIRAGKIEIVAAVEDLTAEGVLLADGSVLRPDAVIAATGYTTGLEPIVGHLGVLDDSGRPRVYGGPAVAPGLRFSGYTPNINNLYHEGRRTAEEIARELADDAAPPAVLVATPGTAACR
jgi:cation diffusion facilitator CzcD-associated flavoprotein CzcO